MYVVEKDASTNTVRVGDDRELFSATFGAVDAVWPSGAVDGPVACDAVVCYHGRRHPAHVTRTGDCEFRVDCERPVRAIAPGQSVVCYDGDRVVCGGVIAAGTPDATAGREATPFSAARGQAATDHSDDGGM